jgi:hypothetical protein
MTGLLVGVKALLGSKLAALAVGALLPLAVVFLKKFIPGKIEKYLGELVRKGLDPKTEDPKLKELLQNAVLHNVMLAEYLIPDEGVGEVKKARVMAALEKAVGPDAAKLLSAMIDVTVSSADSELKKLAEEAKAKIAK